MTLKMAAPGLWIIPLLLLGVFVEFNEGLPRFLRGRPRGGMLGTPAVKWNGDLPPDQWFTQKRNHFSDADTNTWQQRYYVNDTFYKPGGPVFLMIGGEGTASPVWMVTGSWIEYAKKYNALCFQLEHRFYGKSHPTPDMSVENLVFLSSMMALADLAHFRTQMTVKYNLTDAKWIAFGGSYPGSLAAWFRYKYPHLVTASVATSAPILAQLNFPEYLGVVRDSLATTGPHCNPAIANATATLSDMIKSEQGRATIKKMFRLCDDISIDQAKDVANLFTTLAGNFENVVQYNKDNRAFEGGVGTNVTIDVLCGIMSEDKIGAPVNRYATVNSLILDTYKEKCLDFSYDKMIKEMRQTDWDSSAGEGGRQWVWQTCTEFGFYQSSDLDNQPFGNFFPLGFSVQQCADIYGKKFDEALIKRGIERSNENFGGMHPQVTRVVFPNGSIDPWHALGVTKDLSDEATAIYINGTAHCANMYPASPDDSPQLVKARQLIEKKIGEWLQ